MANNAVKTPLFRAISSRSYCSKHGSGKLNPISGTITEIKSCTLPNKLIVSAADTGSPIARLSFIFKAGPRYETHDNLGAAHTLRLATGLATKNYTSFAIVRNLQQVGANLTCTTDRETVAYTLTGTHEAVKSGSKYLCEIATCQALKPWELAEVNPKLNIELACLAPEIKVVELLHAAAYRSGLGNSLFCPKHRAGRLSPETLQHYIHQTMTAERAAVVGVGVDPNELTEYAKNSALRAGGMVACAAAKYYGGGEARRERGGNLAYVALATEAGALNDSVVYDILKHALGTGPRVHMGNVSSGALSRATSKIGGDHPVAVSAFNNSYSDSGLFGVMMVCGAGVAGEMVRAAAGVLRGAGSLTEQDVARAKQQVMLEGLIRLEAGDSCVSNLASQAVWGFSPQTPSEFISSVDKITIDDVKKAAQKIASGKLTMASVGNLSTVPYLDQIK